MGFQVILCLFVSGQLHYLSVRLHLMSESCCPLSSEVWIFQTFDHSFYFLLEKYMHCLNRFYGTGVLLNPTSTFNNFMSTLRTSLENVITVKGWLLYEVSFYADYFLDPWHNYFSCLITINLGLGSKCCLILIVTRISFILKWVNWYMLITYSVMETVVTLLDSILTPSIFELCILTFCWNRCHSLWLVQPVCKNSFIVRELVPSICKSLNLLFWVTSVSQIVFLLFCL